MCSATQAHLLLVPVHLSSLPQLRPANLLPEFEAANKLALMALGLPEGTAQPHGSVKG